MLRYFPLINAVWFQLAWFAAIIYKQQAIPFLLASIIIHLLVSPKRKVDTLLLISVATFGVMGDILLSYFNIFLFTNGVLIPFWLVLLWCHFSFAVNHSLGWLSRIPMVFVVLLGAIAGPLNYLAGYRLGAVDFYYSYEITLFSVGVIWAVNLCVFTIIQKRLSQRFDNKGIADVQVN